MNIERFQKLCLSQPGATGNVQWGSDLVFKIAGKMFAVAALDVDARYRVSFKCSDEGFAELQEMAGAVPAPYLARAKWIALERFETLSDRDMQDRIAEAYTLVVARLTKKAQAGMLAAGRPTGLRAGKPSPSRRRTGSRSRARSRRGG